MSNQLLAKVVKQTNTTNTGTVFFFHGSGDTGPGLLETLKFLVGNFSLPHIKFVFPTAPLRHYTPLQGELSHVWFDRFDISPRVPEHKETLESIGHEITKLIQNEVASGVPLNKIIIGGFSMGGCLALHTAYRFSPGLGGVFALSSFLNDGSTVYDKLQEVYADFSTPLLMFHGERDMVVPIQWARNSFNNLVERNIKGEFVQLKNTLHELKKNEIERVLEWIVKIVPS